MTLAGTQPEPVFQGPLFADRFGDDGLGGSGVPEMQAVEPAAVEFSFQRPIPKGQPSGVEKVISPRGLAFQMRAGSSLRASFSKLSISSGTSGRESIKADGDSVPGRKLSGMNAPTRRIPLGFPAASRRTVWVHARLPGTPISTSQ